MGHSELQPKYRIFVDEWVIHKNAARAARAIGSSDANSRTDGWRLMQRPEIRAAIKQRLAQARKVMAGRMTMAGLTKERWLKELGAMAFTKLTDFATLINEGTEYTEGKGKDAVTTVTIKPVVGLTDSEFWSDSMKRAVKKINADGTIELYDKKLALELIGKAMDWIEDKQIIPSNVKVNITIPSNGREIEPPKK